MKKNLFMIVISFSIIVICLGNMPYDCYAESLIAMSVVNSGQEIQPRADIFEWRYKVVNKKLYKRLYNCSRQKWVGDWIEIK